jgi:cation:H+ antiporter
MIQYILFFIGIYLLVKGANYLVEGSSSLAAKIRVPTIIIGLTIVAFGTSMPELIVNVVAALKGSTQVAFGNIIGSNIANILLVLGLTAIVYPLKVESSIVRKEIPFSILAVIVLFIVSNYVLIDKINITTLTRVSGLVLLCFFGIFIYYTLDMAKKSKRKIEKKEIGIKSRPILLIITMILGGLVGLFIGGRLVVEGAIFTARQLGLSEFLISATIIAIGTSLPELVTGITAAKRKKPSLTMGNAVGSNIFNIFWILGVTAIIAPIIIPSFINIDIILLGAFSLLLFAFVFIGKQYEIERWQGFVFVFLYIAYLAFIIIRG